MHPGAPARCRKPSGGFSQTTASSTLEGSAGHTGASSVFLPRFIVAFSLPEKCYFAPLKGQIDEYKGNDGIETVLLSVKADFLKGAFTNNVYKNNFHSKMSNFGRFKLFALLACTCGAEEGIQTMSNTRPYLWATSRTNLTLAFRKLLRRFGWPWTHGDLLPLPPKCWNHYTWLHPQLFLCGLFLFSKYIKFYTFYSLLIKIYSGNSTFPLRS